jgi:hypothetical protein
MRVILLTLLLLTSCAGLPNDVKSAVDQVKSKPYKIHVYDCSNMAYRLCIALDSLGYNAYILRVRNHAIVKLTLHKTDYYLDCTQRNPYIERPVNVLEVWTARQLKWLNNEKYINNILNEYNHGE